MKSELSTNFDEPLMAGSLTDDQVIAQTGRPALVKIIPDANVVKIGGQSLIDRGRSAVFPLIDEIVANLSRHKMIIGTGAGTRTGGASISPGSRSERSSTSPKKPNTMSF